MPKKNAPLSPEPAAIPLIRFPDSPYELAQIFPPAGDQPTAIAQLVEGIEDGERFQTLLGVTGSGKTYTMANVIARTGRPAIVFAPNKTLAAQLYSEFREFFPNNAVEYFVSYYDYYQPEAYVPQRDWFIEKDSAINEQIEQMRLSATKSVLERRDTIIVATVSAIYGIGAPESYTQMRFILRPRDKISQREAIAQLVRMQYQRNDLEFTRGKFRVRGDTIDVFPAEHSELAVRIELFDDEVEALAEQPGGLDGVDAGFTGADADDFFDVGDKDLAIADAAGLGCVADRLDDGLRILVCQNDFDLHLGQEVDNVFGATVKFRVPFLASKALRLGDGDTLQADFLQRLLHLIELEGLDDRFDLFHEKMSLRFSRLRAVCARCITKCMYHANLKQDACRSE